MKDLFQCVMNREQFQDFCVDVPYSTWPTYDGFIITGHYMGGPVYEHCTRIIPYRWYRLLRSFPTEQDDEVIITPGNCRDTSLLEAWIQGEISVNHGFLRRWRNLM